LISHENHTNGKSNIVLVKTLSFKPTPIHDAYRNQLVISI
jgi:hypothetical protein